MHTLVKVSLNDSKTRTIHNPNVSDEAKESAAERLQDLEKPHEKDPARVAAGLKG